MKSTGGVEIVNIFHGRSGGNNEVGVDGETGWSAAGEGVEPGRDTAVERVKRGKYKLEVRQGYNTSPYVRRRHSTWPNRALRHRISIAFSATTEVTIPPSPPPPPLLLGPLDYY